MKSVRLTKEMREDIAMQLTRKAAKARIEALNSEIEKVSSMFWTEHAEKCQAKLRNPRKEWPQLILDGMVAATSVATPVVPREDGNGCGPYLHEFEVKTGSYGAYVHPTDAMVLNHFPVYEIRYSGSRRAIQLKASSSMPRFNGYEVVETDSAVGKAYVAASKKLIEILDACRDMHSKTMDVLMACTTSRQLEDLLPEAAKLMPQPAAKTQAVMPSELAAKVRGMIETGIPV